jgi:hypothetical protein
LSFLTDLVSNFWVSLLAKLLLAALFMPLIGIVLTFSEIKLSAKMQHRGRAVLRGRTLGLGLAHRGRDQVLPKGGPDTDRR